MMLILEKSLIQLVKIAPAKFISLYRLDLKNAECIGYQEEKILMFIHGDLLVNVNIIVNSMMLIIL
jgi:hypothetical protein